MKKKKVLSLLLLLGGGPAQKGWHGSVGGKKPACSLRRFQKRGSWAVEWWFELFSPLKGRRSMRREDQDSKCSLGGRVQGWRIDKSREHQTNCKDGERVATSDIRERRGMLITEGICLHLRNSFLDI
jgi:hypothetical protein